MSRRDQPEEPATFDIAAFLAEGQKEPGAELRQAAAQIREIYVAFKSAGFTSAHALALTMHQMSLHQGSQNN